MIRRASAVLLPVKNSSLACSLSSASGCFVQRRLPPRNIARNFASSSSSSLLLGGRSNNNSRHNKRKKATLRVHGPDQKGIVAGLSQVLDHAGCAISQSEHWTDTCQSNMFFQRIQFSHPSSAETKQAIAAEIQDICQTFHHLHYTLNWREHRPRMAVFVSKYDHCLWEILLRHEAGELDCDICAVVSNHTDLQAVAEQFEIPYYYFPIHDDTSKRIQEPLQLQLLLGELAPIDLIVLARYMQILSPAFLQHFEGRILNIHHSFLPAFSGRGPYQQAFERGVKLIGATAHYVTAVLDDGPIVEQDVLAVSHRDTPMRMRQKGRIVERTVLVRAVQAHLEDRIIAYQNKCVVFGDSAGLHRT